MRGIVGCLCGMAIILACNAPAAAQRPRPDSKRFPVLVLLSTAPLSQDLPFVIHRRLGSAPRDIIVLSPRANADQFGDAIFVLLTTRHISGDEPQTAAVLRMRPNQQHPGGSRSFPWIPRVLYDLQHADTQNIANVGSGRAIQIWLPRQALGKQISKSATGGTHSANRAP
jgi:hypothetical protein